MNTEHHSITHLRLDLPIIPTELLPRGHETDQVLWNPPPRSCRIDGQEHWNAQYQRLQVPPALSAWIRDHIAQDACEEGFCHLGEAQRGLPHTDKNRDWTLLYFWDLGGEAVDTVWWCERGQPFYRPEQVLPTDYDHLIEMQRARFVLGSWWLLNARMIHSIENLSRTRHSVQIGFRNGARSIDAWLAQSVDSPQ